MRTYLRILALFVLTPLGSGTAAAQPSGVTIFGSGTATVDGLVSAGDDALLINPEIGFFDQVRVTCGVDSLCGFNDTDVGGTNDGSCIRQ